MRKYCFLILTLLHLSFTGWIFHKYFMTKMRLMDSYDMHSNMLLADMHIVNKTSKGNASLEWMKQRIATNLHYKAQYVIRRNIMNLHARSFIRFSLAKGYIVFNEQDKELYAKYELNFRKWLGQKSEDDYKWRISGWDEFEIWLYIKWMQKHGIWNNKLQDVEE